ncbi:MAG: response regulator transcription factor [Chloroflexi bacterium]|nr:response regulator transcription factor [Chloroflexota bacterium]
MQAYSTILIASPSAIVREGLKALLSGEPSFYWVGEVVGEEDLLARARDLRVDVLVLDLDLLDDGGDDLPARVRQAAPETHVVGLADSWHDTRIVSALRGGAHGFIARRSTVAEIAEALRAAQSGALMLHPAAADLLVGQLPSPESAIASLSAREQEVLRLLARGLANKAIAKELVVSEHTVKFHIRSILDKLNAANRTDAVRIGLERGLISI